MSSEAVKSQLLLIAAVARNGTIGHDNKLLWRIPEDLQYFKKQTAGCPVIMGRKTWDSLPERFRPLPGRHNIVVTRQPGWAAAGTTVTSNLDEALAVAGDAPRIFVIGGGELYAEALPRADELLLTELQADFTGDIHFPDWDRAQFAEASRERRQGEPPNDFAFDFVRYLRK